MRAEKSEIKYLMNWILDRVLFLKLTFKKFMHNLKELIIWHKSMDLAVKVYKAPETFQQNILRKKR
jgi:hypothetical protein